MSEVKLGKYRHYKGKFYEVIGVGVNSETLEEYVVYKPLYIPEPPFEGKLWVRPIKMFQEEIEFKGKKIKRFEYQGI